MDNPDSPHDYGWRSYNPGRLLSNALRHFEDRVLGLMTEAGYSETKRTHVNLTRHLDLEGTRITELAKRAGMTNAAMSELIDQCVTLGLVERSSDPVDKRVRIVRFTPKGLRWLSAFGNAVRQAEGEMANRVGGGVLPEMLKALDVYVKGTESPQE
jgi:DNA-binding MarR family transcriptional regulator